MKTDIEIKLNFRAFLSNELGDIVDEHKGKNIFLDSGRTFLTELMGYDTDNYAVADPPPDLEPAVAAGPSYTRQVTAGTGSPTTADVHMPYRPFFIAVGVGGNQQSGPVPGAGAAGTVDGDYPGTNIQSDADPSVLGLERPCQVSNAGGAAPAWARWVKPVSVSFPTTTPYTWIKYTAVFTAADLNDSGIPSAPGFYPSIPVSEAGLYRWNLSQDEGVTAYTAGTYTTALPFISGSMAAGNAMLAYETFAPLIKTAAPPLTLTVEWSLLFA